MARAILPPDAAADPAGQVLAPVAAAPQGLVSLATAFPLPWSHYVRLLSVENLNARRFYEAEALRGGWSVRQLDRQIGTQFYERTALSKRKAAMLEKGKAPRPRTRWRRKKRYATRIF